MNSENPEHELSEAELSELIAQLQSDEDASLESTLDSQISFRNWIDSNPALRQMRIPERISDIVPTMLKFLRSMLGLDSGLPHISMRDLGERDESS